MVKYVLKVCFLITVFFLLTFPSHSLSEEDTNTPNAIAAPRTNRLISYTINAESALLIQKNHSEFKLVLKNVYHNVTMSLNEERELIETPDFISAWGKIKNIKVQADLTGVQINNKRFGHTQFYATVFLKNPLYVANNIVFELIPIKPPIKMQSPQANLKNVTLYINGCDFFDCRNTSLSFE